MSTDCYQVAYERATREIAEVDAQIQKLIRRKELLENLLEPLTVLVSESGPAAVPAASAGDPRGEIPSLEVAAQRSPLVVMLESRVVESGPFEDPARMAQEAEGTCVHAEGNGQSLAYEDVAGLAYRFWNERGQAHGHHEEDWFRAASELQNSSY